MSNLGEGIHNTDPTWLTITDHNLDDYPARSWLVDKWREHTKRLEVMLPDDAELVRRWWRLLFTTFVQRELRKNGYPRHNYKDWGSDEYVLNEDYPWMKDKWVSHRLKLTASVPPLPVLRKRWWYGKRHDMVMRWIGGRNRHSRHRWRVDVVLARLLWCRHSECWKFRLNLLFLVVFILCFVYYAKNY